jgi:hypothetical protein
LVREDGYQIIPTSTCTPHPTKVVRAPQHALNGAAPHLNPLLT